MDLSDPHERELIQAAIDGDVDALNLLLRRYEPRLRGRLRVEAHWQSMVDIDDILQVTYLEAFEHIARFSDQGPGSFAAWVERIARNNYRDAVRGLSRDKRPHPGKRVEEQGPSRVGIVERMPGAASTPSRHAARAEWSADLERAIVRLPESYARVIRMCDLGGMNIRDAAHALGCSPGALHMRQARAHERLQALLGSGSQYLSR